MTAFEESRPGGRSYDHRGAAPAAV